MYGKFFAIKTVLALILFGLTGQLALAAGPGSFQRLGGAFAPFGATSMFLLTDGTVMVQVGRHAPGTAQRV